MIPNFFSTQWLLDSQYKKHREGSFSRLTQKVYMPIKNVSPSDYPPSFNVPYFAATIFAERSVDSVSNVLEFDISADIKTGTRGKTLLDYFWSYDYQLETIITSKNELYYGNRGLILNSSFEPIFMQTVRVRPRHINNHKDPYISNPITFVSPLIFDNPTGIIEKTIITYLSLLYKAEIVYLSEFDIMNKSDINDLKIQHLHDIIFKPALQPMNKCTTEAFNKIIL